MYRHAQSRTMPNQTVLKTVKMGRMYSQAAKADLAIYPKLIQSPHSLAIADPTAEIRMTEVCMALRVHANVQYN